jgi:hypothetical protein
MSKLRGILLAFLGGILAMFWWRKRPSNDLLHAVDAHTKEQLSKIKKDSAAQKKAAKEAARIKLQLANSKLYEEVRYEREHSNLAEWLSKQLPPFERTPGAESGRPRDALTTSDANRDAPRNSSVSLGTSSPKKSS